MFTLLWNHRWEYDKAPEVFADAVDILLQRHVGFRLALLGARGQSPHPALQRIRHSAAARIVADGRLPIGQYRETLGKAGIVVSSAIHEFQGLAVLEAVAAGAMPVVPDALCYPEQYPAACRYPAGDARALADHLQARLTGNPAAPPDLAGWHGESLLADWRSTLRGLLDSVYG